MDRCHAVHQHLRFPVGLVAALVAVLLTPTADALYFSDSTKVNVMREFDPLTHTQVTGYSKTTSQTGSFSWAYFGSPWKPAQREGGSYLSDVNTAITEITLPGTYTVGSFRVQYSPSYQTLQPYQFALEGWNGSSWVPLHTGNPVSYDYSGSFAPTSVSKVRYTSTGVAGGGSNPYNYTLCNFNLYLSTGQSIPLDDGRYSLIHDTSRVLSSSTSPNQTLGPWNNFNFGATTGYDAINGNYESYNLKTQDSARRGYMTWNFDQQYFMDYGMLAGVIDYSISNWELYTRNDSNPAAFTTALNALSTTTVADIMGLGWTLQYQQVGPGGGEKLFDFAVPGKWQYLMLVQDGQSPAWGQLEVYGIAVIPEPATLALLVMGGWLLWWRRPNGG